MVHNLNDLIFKNVKKNQKCIVDDRQQDLAETERKKPNGQLR